MEAQSCVWPGRRDWGEKPRPTYKGQEEGVEVGGMAEPEGAAEVDAGSLQRGFGNDHALHGVQ